MKLLQCPRCRLLLDPVLDGGGAAACLSCGGLWTPAGVPVPTDWPGDGSRLSSTLATFEGLPVPCPECPGSRMAEREDDPRQWVCDRCGGAWRDLAASLVAEPPSAPVPAEPPASDADAVELSEAESILKELLAGNHRFAAGLPAGPNRTPERRRSTAQLPKPRAAVFCCADSRVPPEIVLDQGLGDLFVVRLAGNTLDAVALDTLEFAVGELGLPLVLVLGHTRCVAVQTAVERGGEGDYLLEVMRELKPAADWARTAPGNAVENAIRRNVQRQARRLAKFLSEWVQEGRTMVVGAVYDVDTGLIERLAPVPEDDDEDGEGLEIPAFLRSTGRAWKFESASGQEGEQP